MKRIIIYKGQRFIRVSWGDYGKTLNTLYKKVNKHVKKNDINIDAVIPILRGGSFAGAYLAFQLDLIRILPIQYKYFFSEKKIELRKVLSISKECIDLPKDPVFLLVENNHCFGISSSNAAKDIKKDFPECRIIHVVDHMDYSCQKNRFADEIFYGKLTNETKALTQEECKLKDIENGSYLFPWERVEEEMKMAEGKQFHYKDLKSVLNGSESKVIMDKDRF